jgi:hypothetical protein
MLAAAVPAYAADKRFTVTDFDRIQVEGPYEVVLATGKAPSAIATGSNEALDRVAISVQGRTLRVRPDRSGWGGYPGEGKNAVRISVTTHDLRGASVTGAGSLIVDKAKAMRFDAAVSGTGRIGIGAIAADTMIVGLLGSGRIEAAGTAKMLRATIQGSGDFKAPGLTAQDAEINADTAGIIEVSVRGTAKVTSTGPGETHIGGKPACTVKALGSGRVQCGS